jgi:putative transposase
MGRPLRAAAGGIVYHVVNRANARAKIFEKPADYDAFERVLAEAHDHLAMRTIAYCLMPNHWHMVLWPIRDGDLPRFMAWLTLTHTQRWHAHRGSTGTGHVYQGRYRSFPVEADEHFLTVCRYVERNALRASLVARAEEWRWCSLWQETQRAGSIPKWLAAWPLDRPSRWLEWVNQPQSASELDAIRGSVRRGRPYGNKTWVTRMAKRLGLESTLRPRGRPKCNP